MPTSGLLALLLAVVPLAWAWAQHRRRAHLVATPLLRTGDVAESEHADVSFEGTIRAIQPFAAPCSGEACVYVEIDVVREWTRSVATPTGARIEHGRDVLRTYRTGAAFLVDDGSGPALVNPTDGLDAPLEPTFEQTRPVTDGTMWFGRLRVDVPPPPDGAHVVCVKAVERIFRARGDVFVIGALEDGLVARPRRAHGRLRATRRTRDAELGEARRRAGAGLLVATLLATTGGALAASGQPAAAEGPAAVRASDAAEVGELVGDASGTAVPPVLARPPATATPPSGAALPKARAKKRRAAR